ncbi:LytR C-terminal domain-containing protein [Microbacterium sp. NPDC055683]
MPTTHPRDRFDEIAHESGRVGAHRAEHPGMRAGVVVGWAAVATAVLVIAGILGFLVLSQQGAITVPENTAAEPAPTADAALDTSYSVLVLNGTATEGLEDEVAQQIIDAGFAEGSVSASASSATDFETTTVYYASDDDEAAARGLADAIGQAEVVQSTEYQAEGSKELTVVIGLDRVTAG